MLPLQVVLVMLTYMFALVLHRLQVPGIAAHTVVEITKPALSITQLRVHGMSCYVLTAASLALR